MDAALDVLRMIRFTGGIFLDAEFSAPWCVVAQVTPEDCRPFTPVPEGILAYHYVSAGRLLLLGISYCCRVTTPTFLVVS